MPDSLLRVNFLEKKSRCDKKPSLTGTVACRASFEMHCQPQIYRSSDIKRLLKISRFIKTIAPRQ